VRAVRPAAVVVLTEVVDHHLHLRETAEHLAAEELVADAAVEALHERVLPRAPGFDECRAGPAEVDHPIGIDAALRFHRERLAGELVDDVEQLDRAAVVGDVELEVERPYVIWALRAEAIARHR
jgi:dienelactone hydrolase